MQPTEMNINIFISGVQADQELRKILDEHPDSLSYSGKITIWQKQESNDSSVNGGSGEVVKDLPLPVRLYCCYAKEDETEWNKLRTHLAALQRGEKIAIQDNQSFLGGDKPSDESLKRLDVADIVLLLITNYFVADDQCYKLIGEAMKRHCEGTLRVVPVLLDCVDYQGESIHGLQWLPRNGIPIKHWPNSQDAAYAHVIEETRKVVKVVLEDRNGAQGNE